MTAERSSHQILLDGFRYTPGAWSYLDRCKAEFNADYKRYVIHGLADAGNSMPMLIRGNADGGYRVVRNGETLATLDTYSEAEQWIRDQ